MKTKTATRVLTIQAATPEAFDERVNAILGLPNLMSYRLTFLNRADFAAHLEYTIEESYFENIKEEFEARGEIYYCDECPYLERNPDGRVKTHSCKCGKTTISRRACLLFYQELAKGEIEPKGGRL